MDTQIQYASFSRRVRARFLDGLIAFIPVMSIAVWLVFNTDNNSDVYRKIIFFGLFIELTCLTCILFFWFAYSATPGKLILKIKIADSKTFKIPTQWQFVKRLLLQQHFLIIQIFSQAYCLTSNTVCGDTPLAVKIITFILAISDLICFIFTKQKQTLCDIIAGTVVIGK